MNDIPSINNYTKITKREKLSYKFLDVTISRQGISNRFLSIFGVSFVITNIFGILFTNISGMGLYNILDFMDHGTPIMMFYALMIGIPFGITSLLLRIKIQNYKLIDFLKLYFQPKDCIDENKTKITLDIYEVNNNIKFI